MTTRKPTLLWTFISVFGGLTALGGQVACTPSIEDYPRELEEAFCEWQHECHAYERVRDCVDSKQIESDPQYDYLVRAVAGGSVAYDRDAAADCLHAISERSCVEDDEPPEVCDRVFAGKVGRNGPCLNSAECAGNAVCGFDPACSDQCCVGACRVFADPVAIGEPCSFGGVACVPEAFCASDPVTFLATVCTRRVKAGGDCSLGQVCVEGVECDGSMCREVEQLKEGDECDVPFATCVEPARCAYQAEGQPPRCAVPPTLGAPCDPNNDTCDRVDTYCDAASMLCTLLPGPGQACLNGYTCIPYTYCEGGGGFDEFGEPTGSATAACTRRGGEGDSCNDYDACLGDLECIAGHCEFPELTPAPVCPVPGS